MKGSECRLIEFMDGSKKRFVIPVYQRYYDWQIEQCRQLYDDLVKVSRKRLRSHFFGSIVSVYNPDGRNTEFLVIDGQQRLTTVSLLMLAMCDLIKRGAVTSDTPNLSQQLYEDYLVDKWSPDETRIKLKPVKGDQLAFGKLFADPEEHIKTSNLTANYDYFRERILKQEITVDELYDAICRLEIINITLNNDDNPQLIFESLNSTGLALSEGDKIRNYMLMGLRPKQQNSYYDKYWNPIEECTDYDVSAFVRDYLSIKQQAIPAQSRVYVRFKEYVEQSELETEALLKDLLAYAKRYRTLLHGGTSDKELNACISRLNRLETTVTRPFFLEVLRLRDEQILSLAEVSEIFGITESFLFRRSICELPSNVLNKLFAALHMEIVRYDGTVDNYVEKFKYALLSKQERSRFPDDVEFGENFATRQVYMMNGRNKVYILERLENYDTLEDKDVYAHCDDGTYTIEHIMPQHLTQQWKLELGEDWERVHELWLHRIANLTLTAYNSKYSNLPFAEKKHMKHGFDDSGIRLNSFMASKDRWTLAELEERSEYLKNLALDIWAMPQTQFRPRQKQLDSVSLDDEVDLRGRGIARFRLQETELPVRNWVEMYQKVLQLLYVQNKAILAQLAASPDSGLAIHFSTNADDFTNCQEIGDGIYVWTNTDTQYKLSVLRQVFRLYNIDPADLIFYLRGDSDAEAEDDNTRFALRKKYWTYALEYIRDTFGDEGPYSNTNPSRDNWINGFFGVGGFNLCCVANYSGSRVEICLGRADAADNKRAFDMLLSHKAEIEKELGIPLIWDRGDGKISSKIYTRFDNVSIDHEDDWPRMAQFHAHWSKRFYDVIVPWLKRWQEES